MRSINDLTAGRWPELLQSLGGISPDQLTNKHQPCPSCGGTDRFRWDNDDGPGGCYCNQCGGKNQQGGGMTGMDLLLRVTGWDFKQAVSRIEQHLGLPSPAVSAPKKSKRPHRTPAAPPVGTPPPSLGRAVAQWCYTDADGNQLFWVQRIPKPPKNGEPQKLFVQRTWLDNQWHFPSNEDPFDSHWPAPRPLYNLHKLTANPNAPVLITEGEKSADAAAPLFPNHVCIAWCGGVAGVQHTDWSPLSARTVTIWPDNDDPGRQCMAKLAPRLQRIGCTVSIVNPPPNTPHKWDLADAPTSWTPQRAATELAAHARLIDTLPDPQPTPDPEPEHQNQPPTPPPDIPDNAPFTCLGFDGDSYYYQPGNTGQVIRLTAPGHSTNNLLRLAELPYWQTIYPSKSGVDWQSAVSSLLARQARTGVYSPDRIRGRGAWIDDNRSILHLGDRLIVDGISHSVMAPPPSRFNYQRLTSIEIPLDITPLTDHEGAELLDIASRFHWEVPASGILLAGWLALAPICGALSWRPHIWLTASAGSGKSAILNRFLGPILESLALWPEGNTTEAFIRQELRSDALPVIFDEAESNEQSDRKRIQDILALARVASSSGRGVIGKGGADGAAQRFTVRSMFLMCSISTALKQGADRSRFAQLTLRNPSYLPKSDRIAHWSALDADLTRIITTTAGHRLLHRSVRSISIIRDSVAAFRRAAADRFDSQREGDQYGTLLAGAWSLMNQHVATEADAYTLIDQNDWQPYKEANAEPDEHRCLQTILQHQLRVETDRQAFTRTIGELVEIANHTASSIDITPDTAEAHLGRIGIKTEDGNLFISNTAKGIERILSDTPWPHSWATVLSRIPGAVRAGVIRFKGIGSVSRAVSVPIRTIQG
jgi:putative DNA primase/helicase